MNCKPGDLAIIVCDPEWRGKDIGKIVKVISVADDWLDADEPEWSIVSISGPLSVYDDNELPLPSCETDIKDKNLRPLSPPATDSSTETEKEKEHV